MIIHAHNLYPLFCYFLAPGYTLTLHVSFELKGDAGKIDSLIRSYEPNAEFKGKAYS